MITPFFKIASVCFMLLISSIATDKKKIKVWLIGDSTCANKEIKAYPETGWGMPFRYFFDSTVEVDNRALNGRSTKSFIAENRWQPVLDNLQEGDYVFIQFGHNDEGKEKVGRYTTPDEFKANLTRYVNETRSKNGIPVLITPVARRTFDSATAQIKESHPIYADAVREVAKQNNVPLIDLDEKSKALLQQFGPEDSKLLFNHLTPGEHPNYPSGNSDNTHFNELGARRIAEIVLADIKNLHLGLADRIVKPPVKK
ncbi:MAG: GntR family transcriptional regulator [Segetibacter sp.]|nr:GntR family transcriptional regulator [Segetibacter sp.]